MNLEQYEDLVMNSPLKMCMRTLFTSPRSHMAKVLQKHDNLKVHHRHKGYGCLVGIYIYHTHPELIDEDSLTNMLEWEQYKDMFQNELGIEFGNKGPYSIDEWPAIKKASYLATNDDKERKRIALDVLRTMINEQTTTQAKLER